jgi:hypothetical protein
MRPVRFARFLILPLVAFAVLASAGPAPAAEKPIKTTGKAKTGGGEPAPAKPSLFIVCQMNPSMDPGQASKDGSQLLFFKPAAQAANVAPPGPGECAFEDRTVREDEPKRLGLNGKMIGQLTEIGSIFKVRVSVMKAFMFATGDMEVTPPGGAAAAGGEGEPADGGGVAVGSADCPAGTATVSTPAGLDFLNVRQEPSRGAKVLAQVPNGSPVTVSGSCIDPAKGAGFAKQTLKPKVVEDGGGAAVPGGGAWCRISAPDEGCVDAQFLVFAGGDVPLDAAKGAGFAKQKEKPAGKGSTTFAGKWSLTADDGTAYDLKLSQLKTGVFAGDFHGDDGSAGVITGNARGNTLRFGWVQADKQAGSGKFVLSADGGTLAGSYNFQVGNFDKVEGTWNGTRVK